MTNRRLVLFDIDGTLVLDDGAAREAFALALADAFGYGGELRRYDFSGRTDPEIAFMILRDAGLADRTIEAGLPVLWSAYLRELSVRATRERVRVLPGVQPLLEVLGAMPRITLGLLTGNIEGGARLKLTPHALNRWFPFGAFGSDSINRHQLAPIAVERASRIDGHRFSGRDVVIIGDSIHDVRCGVPHEATTIAVASGRTPADLLRAEHPHHFFESLEATDEIVAAITAEPS